MPYQNKQRGKQDYYLENGGYVSFDWDKDVQAASPWNGMHTRITLINGVSYILLGRNYGV
jgi:hypothetical protein